MNRSEKNWFSFGFGIAYLPCYLFLPFYKVFVVPITGLTLVNYTNAMMVLPIVLGFLMMLSPLLLDAKISLFVGGASLIITLIFLFFGASLASMGGFSGALSNTASDLAGMSFGSLLSGVITPGIGGIFCLLLCVGHIVFELTQGSKKTIVVHREDDFFS